MIHLENIIPRKLLKYKWIFPVRIPPLPSGARAPYSTQGLQILDGIPTGAAIAVGGGAGGDHLRGTLDIFIPWLGFQLGGGLDTILMNVYTTGDTIDPDFVNSVANSANGKCNIIVPPADDAITVTVRIVSQLRTVLGMLGIMTRYETEGGDILNNPAFPDQVLIIAPRTYAASIMQDATLAMAGVIGLDTVQQPELFPFFFAGFHPGPWMLFGAMFNGFTPPRQEEGEGAQSQKTRKSGATKATKATKGTKVAKALAA